MNELNEYRRKHIGKEVVGVEVKEHKQSRLQCCKWMDRTMKSFSMSKQNNLSLYSNIDSASIESGCVGGWEGNAKQNKRREITVYNQKEEVNVIQNYKSNRMMKMRPSELLDWISSFHCGLFACSIFIQSFVGGLVSMIRRRCNSSSGGNNERNSPTLWM